MTNDNNPSTRYDVMSTEVERLDRINSDQTHELDYLHKEIERLRALGPDDDWEERGAAEELRAEIERLKADNALLQAELRELLEWFDGCDPRTSARAVEKARRALEHKP